MNKIIAEKNEKQEKSARRLTGTVSSTKMQKTVVVKVNRMKMNKKYRKQYLVSTKYKAHDEKGQYKEGDKVIIEATKPISREKRWTVIGKVNEEKA